MSLVLVPALCSLSVHLYVSLSLPLSLYLSLSLFLSFFLSLFLSLMFTISLSHPLSLSASLFFSFFITLPFFLFRSIFVVIFSFVLVCVELCLCLFDMTPCLCNCCHMLFSYQLPAALPPAFSIVAGVSLPQFQRATVGLFGDAARFYVRELTIQNPETITARVRAKLAAKLASPCDMSAQLLSSQLAPMSYEVEHNHISDGNRLPADYLPPSDLPLTVANPAAFQLYMLYIFDPPFKHCLNSILNTLCVLALNLRLVSSIFVLDAYIAVISP